MTDTTKNEELRSKAISLGLCEQWQGYWKKDWDDRKMIERYKEGIDFCLANDFPSVEYIKSHFSKEDLRNGGLFMDDKRSVLNERLIVIRGFSDIHARYNGNTVAEIYITDSSTLKLSAKNDCHVIVHVWGNAQVDISQEDNAMVLAIKHTVTCNVQTNKGNATLKEEREVLT